MNLLEKKRFGIVAQVALLFISCVLTQLQLLISLISIL